MKRNHERNKVINWNHCFICQNKKVPPDNTTEDGLKTLCANMTEIWELGELDWFESMVTVTVEGKPDLYGSIKEKARYHHKCYSR